MREGHSTTLLQFLTAIGIGSCLPFYGSEPSETAPARLRMSAISAAARRERTSVSSTVGWVERVLREDAENRFSEVLEGASKCRFQVLVAVPAHLMRSDRVLPGEVGGHQGCHKLRRFAFRSGAEYSYPASCVKLGAAMAALAFIREARAAWGVPVQPCSRLAFHYSLPTSQEAEDNDQAAIEDSDESNVSGPNPGSITLAHEIKKLCLVSDNRAYTRLIGLVGGEYLNDYLINRLGLTSARLIRRLHDRIPARSPVDESLSPAVEIWHSPDGGVCLPRRRWSSPDEQLPINQQHETAEAPAGPGLAAGPGPAAPSSRNRRVGQSHIDVGGIKVDEPMDFAQKNYMSLQDLQDLLILLTRPDLLDDPGPSSGRDDGPSRSSSSSSSSSPGSSTLDGPSSSSASSLSTGIDEGDRLWLMEAMAQYPRQSSNPRYSEERHPDDYAKFFLGGVCRVWDKRAVRVYNKDGQAYGFSSDNALITNIETGESFFLAATVYTNENGIVNDDCYEYQQAERVMEDLAEAITRALFCC